MGVVTVFLTVSLITFLHMMTRLTPILALKTAVAMTGDLDITIRAHHGTKKVQGNRNWYTDEMEFFNAPYLSEYQK